MHLNQKKHLHPPHSIAGYTSWHSAALNKVTLYEHPKQSLRFNHPFNPCPTLLRPCPKRQQHCHSIHAHANA
jgi:hypothetical protein